MDFVWVNTVWGKNTTQVYEVYMDPNSNVKLR